MTFLHSHLYCTALGAALFLAALLAAAEAQQLGNDRGDSPDARRAAALVAQLGSPRYDEREAATRALDALGGAALGPLRQALAGGDAEIRRRARLLIQTIERRLEAARLLTPTRVRLVYREVPVGEAVADVARKTGLPVRFEGDRFRLARHRVTLDTGETDLWEALAQFCHHASLAERPADFSGLPDTWYREDPWDRRILALRETFGEVPESPLVLKEATAGPLPTCLAGAVRVRVLPPNVRPASQPIVEGEALFGLEVRLEPRLQLQGVHALRIDRAVDDEGQTLKQPATALAGTGAVAGGAGSEVLIIWDGLTPLPPEFPVGAGLAPVRLRLGERHARHLRELRGTLCLRVQPAPEQLVTVDPILQAAGRTVQGGDGSALKVSEVRREDDGRVKLAVEVMPAPRDVMLGGVPARILLTTRGARGAQGIPVPPPVGIEQLALLDEQGRKVPLEGSTGPTVNGSGKAWEFSLVFRLGPEAGEPSRLVYTGRRSIALEVPFTLKDVPLP
jgi:hypothetical protein